MQKYTQIPPVLLARAIVLWLAGRVKFPKDQIGQLIKDRGEFVIFRKVVVKPAGIQPALPGAIFKVNFRFARFSYSVNRILSLIPIPFIIAQPGFISKTWLYDKKSGIFLGIYEWSSLEDAEHYWDSFPLNLMKRRSIPGSLRHEIFEIKKNNG